VKQNLPPLQIPQKKQQAEIPPARRQNNELRRNSSQFVISVNQYFYNVEKQN